MPKVPNVVVIGGGTGTPVVLNSLKKYNVNLTAIVAVTDNGSHSGELRRQLNILPPGDIRNCLVALSEADQSLKDLFSYRFKEGFLKGTSIGNLFIAGLTQIHGSFKAGLEETSRILKVKGNVIPATWDDSHICAELSDGTIVETETEVDKEGKSPIKRVFLKPNNVKPSKEALDAIKNADMLILGPTSIYTSILPVILINGFVDAIRDSDAKKVFVCNIVTQPGQTDGYTVSKHVQALENHLGKGVLSHVIINTGVPGKNVIKYYEENSAFLSKDDSEKLKEIGLIKVNVIEDKIQNKPSELALIRHDPEKLGDVLIDLIEG